MVDDLQRLSELVAMSRRLGEPARELVLLGEGNTSAAAGDGSFWVKASGTELATADKDTFVRLWLEPVQRLADGGELSQSALKEALDAARVAPTDGRRPSVETVLHALALGEGGASFVGHTHPVAVNILACAVHGESAFTGRLFPDEIVVCGPAPLWVPYTSPGLPLAKAFCDGMRRHTDAWGEPPKAVVMQNHGFIALGRSAVEVESVTAMFVKLCRILAGTYALGGPHHLTSEQAEGIHTRPDEAYRRQQLRLQ